MRILHIITRLIQGGAQQVVIDTCADMVKRGHEVHVISGPTFGPEGSVIEQVKATGAVLHEVPALRRSINPLQDLRCYRTLRRLVREIRPDIVHTHSSKAGIAGRAAAWAERVPVVIHMVHGTAFHDRQKRILFYMYLFFERFAAKRCHKLIAVTPAMIDLFVENRITTRDKFTVIHAGVDLDRFAADRAQGPAVRRELGIPDDRRVICLLGRIDKLKGHADLIDILPDLPDVHLLVIGDGYNRGAIEQRIAAAGLSGRVTFTGLVSHDAVARLLSCVEVNTLPSYLEGQSMTLVEALAAGCAIAAYDVGGIGSICIDGQTGRLVPVGDKTALRDAIRWLLDHPDEAAALTRRGQQHVREHFSSAGMVRQVERLYLELIK